MAFNMLPSRREELVVQRERLLMGEIGRIDALLKTLDGQQDRLEERLEVLASQVPEDEEPMNRYTLYRRGDGSRLFFVHEKFLKIPLLSNRIFAILYLYHCAFSEGLRIWDGMTIQIWGAGGEHSGRKGTDL